MIVNIAKAWVIFWTLVGPLATAAIFFESGWKDD